MVENTLVVQELAFAMNALLDADGFNFGTPEVNAFVRSADKTDDPHHYMLYMAYLMYPSTGWDVPQTQSVDMAYDIFMGSRINGPAPLNFVFTDPPF